MHAHTLVPPDPIQTPQTFTPRFPDSTTTLLALQPKSDPTNQNPSDTLSQTVFCGQLPLSGLRHKPRTPSHPSADPNLTSRPPLQDDIVHEDLTVRENLEYSPWLRNPKYIRTRAKGDLVDDVIDVLSLRSVQHSVVGTAEKRGIRCAHPKTAKTWQEAEV